MPTRWTRQGSLVALLAMFLMADGGQVAFAQTPTPTASSSPAPPVAGSVTISSSHTTVTCENAPVLTGTVRDRAGRPIPDREVALETAYPSADGTYAWNREGGRLRTDAQGTWRVRVRPCYTQAIRAYAGNGVYSKPWRFEVHRRIDFVGFVAHYEGGPRRLTGTARPQDQPSEQVPTVTVRVYVRTRSGLVYFDEGAVETGSGSGCLEPNRNCGRWYVDRPILRGTHVYVAVTEASRLNLRGTRSQTLTG